MSLAVPECDHPSKDPHPLGTQAEEAQGTGPIPSPTVPKLAPTVEKDCVPDFQDLGKMLSEYHSFLFRGQMPDYARAGRFEETLCSLKWRMPSQLYGAVPVT